jgi:hypothetical protein
MEARKESMREARRLRYREGMDERGKQIEVGKGWMRDASRGMQGREGC